MKHTVFAFLALVLLAVPEAVLAAKQKDTPPKLVSRVDPKYPAEMLASELNGKVTVEFVVDETGTVRDPVVIASNNPGFHEAAIEAIRQWKFKPGYVDGQPVRAILKQPIHFGFEGGRDALSVPRIPKKDKVKLPAEFRYDTPPATENTPLPVYSFEMLRDDVTGHATVALVIDDKGAVVDLLVKEATHPELGLALKAAVNGWLFQPAMKDGKPTYSGIKYEHVFNRSSYKKNNPQWEDELRLLKLETEQPEQILKPRMLDGGLKTKRVVQPRFPAELRDKVQRGEAKIEVVIDGQGRVFLARVRSATEPEFGYAAMHAVAKWSFDPPLSGGRPAIVRTVIPFTFSVLEDAAEDGATGSTPAAGGIK